MNTLKVKLNDTPKLTDCYGDYHDYKLSAQYYDLDFRYHNKKLNILKNISNEKLKRAQNKDNFIKTKYQLNIELKSNKKANSLEIHNQILIIKNEIKEIRSFITFFDILTTEKKIIVKQIKKNYYDTKKTVTSLRNSHDDLSLINKKINAFFKLQFKSEQSLVIQKKLLDKIFKLSFINNDFTFYQNSKINQKQIFAKLSQINLKKEIKEVKQDLLSMNISAFDFIEKDLLDLKNKLVFSFYSQKFFKFSESEKIKEIDFLNQQINNLKKEKINNNQKFETNIKKIINTKKYEINKNYSQNYLSLNSSLEAYQKNLKNVEYSIKKNHNLKKQELIESKNKVKELTKEYKQEYLKNLNFEYKKLDKLNIQELSVIEIIKNPKLLPLFNWKKKIAKLKAKSSFYQNLGNAIKDKTYEGDYKIGVGQALEKFSKDYEIIISNYFHDENKFNKKLEDYNWNEFRQKNLDNKIVERKQLLNKNVSDLKLKFAQKEISKQAYKNAVLKEEVYFEEDIKVIKLNTSKYANKFERKDLGVKFSTSYKVAVKTRDSEINDIRKKTPIEVSKNSSYWKTFLAIFAPGIPDIINRNYLKGILMLMVTAFMYIFILPYAFGAFNIHGKGVIGLIQLSWPVQENPVSGPIYVDSRYSLIEGVIGLLFLILALVFVVVSAILTWKISRNQEMGIRSNNWSETKQILRNNGFPYAISLPGWILIIFIVVMPIIVSVLLAFTNIGHFNNPNAGDETNWVGFEQFIRLFSNPDFYAPLGQVFLWNVIWAISSTSIVIFIGTILALTIESKGIKGKIIWRTIFMLPWAIPAFLSILFYKVIFSDASTGLVNSILLDLGIITNPIRWGADLLPSRIILILIQGWLGHSYIVLLISGYMKSISNDVYEAASIDGAGNQKQFWKLTAPIILIQIAPLLIGQFTFNFNNFSLIYLFNNGGGALDPDFVYQVGSSDIILSWIFKITFTTQGNSIESNQALASAMVILMSIIMISVSGISFARTKAFRRGEENG